MIELLAAAAFATHPAPECAVALERREEARLVLRLRPSCPLGFSSTHGAVRAILAHAGEARELCLAFGRIVEYPWLSALLARQASSSRRWDPAAGRPLEGTENAYVAAALRGMPEFTALFDSWRILGVSVEKVLRRPARELSLPAGAPLPGSALLPYDAQLWVRLARP